MPRTLGFNFLQAGGAAGSAILKVNQHHPVSLVPAFGYLLILNGIDENQKLFDPARRGPLVAADVHPLVYDGPDAPIVPMLSGLGDGRVFGNRYVWAYRFKDSVTGNVTALSPKPIERYDLGEEAPSPGGAQAVGQTAYFYLAGISTSDTQFDRIQLFRNTSGQEDLLFLVEEKANPGTGSYVLFTDNFTDEEIFVNETSTLLTNAPVDAGGPPWPVAKAHVHHTGRVWYYALVRAPTIRITTSVTLNENTVTASSFRASWAGRRFLPKADSGGTALEPTKSYHIVGRSGNVIFPDYAGATASGIYADILDDRDGRAVFQSEVGLPCQVDPVKTFYVGRDPTDDVQHIFARGGMTFAVTKQRILGFDGDFSQNPESTHRQSVYAEEGQVGLWAGVETQRGYVYLHESLGVRVFDGVQAPFSLGGDLGDQFLPSTVLAGIEPGYLNQTRLFYDQVRYHLIVSYVPLGGHALTECLVYDMQNGNWRGPWRCSTTATAVFVDDDGGKRVVYGDGFGNIATYEDATSDVLNRYTGQTISGTVASLDNAYTFRVTASSFDPNSDRRIVGAPIVFYDGSSGYQVNRIAGYDNSTGGLMLETLPSPVLQAGWTFNIAAVRWEAKSAFLDAGEPIQPKVLEQVRLRTTRGSSGASTGGVSDAVDGSSTFSTETGADASIAPDSTCYAHGRIKRTGRMHQLRFRGTSTDGNPQITGAIVDLRIAEGA